MIIIFFDYFFKVEGGNFEKKEQRECAAGVTGTLLGKNKKENKN